MAVSLFLIQAVPRMVNAFDVHRAASTVNVLASGVTSVRPATSRTFSSSRLSGTRTPRYQSMAHAPSARLRAHKASVLERVAVTAQHARLTESLCFPRLQAATAQPPMDNASRALAIVCWASALASMHINAQPAPQTRCSSKRQKDPMQGSHMGPAFNAHTHAVHVSALANGRGNALVAQRGAHWCRKIKLKHMATVPQTVW